MLRANHQEHEGNERYEGFCVDMLKELADILKFKYRIRLVGDGVYGVSGTNGTWTGMVGELISRVSDVTREYVLVKLGQNGIPVSCIIPPFFVTWSLQVL